MTRLVKVYIGTILFYFLKNKKNPIMYVWIYFSIRIFKYLTALWLLISLYSLARLLYLFCTSKKVVLSKRNVLDLFRLNYLVMLDVSKKKKKGTSFFLEIIFNYLILYTILLLFNCGYRSIKLCLTSFDGLSEEWRYSGLVDKKLSLHICSYFLIKSFRRIVYTQFEDVIMYSLQNEIKIKFWGKVIVVDVH